MSDWNGDVEVIDALEKSVDISIVDEMKKSYLDYAMSVIVSRAIPDVRDGLKPVHRRILYAMYESGYVYNKPHKKSARVVGDVIGKYHPHGEGAVYDSLVRMAQNFAMRIPLIDGQGNFGSIDGDAAAAMRYTESRLARPAHFILEDINKDTVSFQPNYDGSESEPCVLPSMFPNILVNGSGGIAVGMATNIPPHNLGEVIDACCHLLHNPDSTVADMMNFIKGPDFPTGGSIIGMSGIRSAYETGRGIILMRAKTEIEPIQNNRQAIIITEVPFMVNKAKLIEKIAELANEKKIEGISDLRDESDKRGIRVVIELKKDVVAEVVLNQLYVMTQMQTSFGVIALALDHGIPRVMSLVEILRAFLRFREEVVTKRVIFLLNKARDRSHILVGLRIAVYNIDKIIHIIKSSKDVEEAKARLMAEEWNVSDILELIRRVDDRAVFIGESTCKFTEVQAKAILEMRLQRLTNMEKGNLEEELQELYQEICKYMEILGSREKLLAVIQEELLKVRADLATERMTQIEFAEFDQDIEDLIQREEMVVTVTLGGYIKRVPLDSYREQKRGGKGRSVANMHSDDIITNLFVGSTHTPMLFFSNTGIVYTLKLYKLPLGTLQTKGRPLVNMLNLKEGETITNIMPLPEKTEEWDNLNIIFSTKSGNIRRNDLSDFKYIPSNGKIAMKLEEGDQLIGVQVCADDGHVMLATRLGKAVRFPVDAVRVFKSRTSDGVRGVKLQEGDEVVSMTMLRGAEYTLHERESYLSIPLEERSLTAYSPEQDLDAVFNELSGKYELTDCSGTLLCAMSRDEELILSVSSNGFGKISSSYEYRVTDRGGSGVVNMAISDKLGTVVKSLPVTKTDSIMLITNLGKLIRCPLKSVRVTGRSTAGVILFKTAEDEHVVSVALIQDTGDSDGNQDEEINEVESGSDASDSSVDMPSDV